MKLIDALESLKTKGITRLVGYSEGITIDMYIDNARRCDEDAQRWPDQEWAKYHIEHADAHFIVEIFDHHIIATHYDTFDMATYGDYETENEMYADFDEWRILRDAEAMADKMTIERPGELSRPAWMLIATAVLREAQKEAQEAFERDFNAE